MGRCRNRSALREKMMTGRFSGQGGSLVSRQQNASGMNESEIGIEKEANRWKVDGACVSTLSDWGWGKFWRCENVEARGEGWMRAVRRLSERASDGRASLPSVA